MKPIHFVWLNGWKMNSEGGNKTPKNERLSHALGEFKKNTLR